MSCIYRSITLQPGESYVLPAGAQLIGATDPNTLTSVNDCAPTDNLETEACYVFSWALSEDLASSVALEHQDCLFQYIEIGSVQYPLNFDPYFLFSSGGNTAVENAFQTAMTGTSFTVDYATENVISDRKAQDLYFKTLPSLASSMRLFITGPDFDNGLFIYPAASNDCTP